MPAKYTMTKEEKETSILYNQTQEPIKIDGYDPNLRRRLAEYAGKYPDLCKRVDKRKYPDYYEYLIQKDRVSIRLLPPMNEEKKQAASKKARQLGLGKKVKTEKPVSKAKDIGQ